MTKRDVVFSAHFCDPICVQRLSHDFVPRRTWHLSVRGGGAKIFPQQARLKKRDIKQEIHTVVDCAKHVGNHSKSNYVIS